MARVVMADDHPLFLQALIAAMEGAGVEVVGTATRGDELVSMLDDVQADAALIDLNMPGYDGFECLALLRERRPEVRLIVVSATDDEASIRRALDAGAICFIGKSIDPDDLAGAVRALLSDAIRLDGGYRRGGNDATPMQNGDAARSLSEILTRRELEILRLVAEGLPNSQMARSLWVTEQTIKFHLSNVYRKIGVRNRTEASRWAQQNGLLDEPV